MKANPSKLLTQTNMVKELTYRYGVHPERAVFDYEIYKYEHGSEDFDD